VFTKRLGINSVDHASEPNDDPISDIFALSPSHSFSLLDEKPP
jgi:hypothetical protein